MPFSSNYTPLGDIDVKLDIIEHVNQDHLEEVLFITQALHLKHKITKARIKDVFVEGMLIDAQVILRTWLLL